MKSALHIFLKINYHFFFRIWKRFSKIEMIRNGNSLLYNKHLLDKARANIRNYHASQHCSRKYDSFECRSRPSPNKCFCFPLPFKMLQFNINLLKKLYHRPKFNYLPRPLSLVYVDCHSFVFDEPLKLHNQEADL